MKSKINKAAIPTRLLWVDLEMTGLDYKKDLIIEVAAIVTDFDFKIVANYEARIRHDKDQLIKLFKANSWYSDQFPQNRDYFLNIPSDAKSSEQVEVDLVEFVYRYFGNEPAVLAGNSIHADRGFIKQYWPIFDTKLHYRMLDVSAWKLVMNTKFGVEFDKQSDHRALGDIKSSIAELEYYLAWFGSHNVASPEME
ncbi:MAG TPA: oligoribonuclease [Candidatus Dormibacteraeota bacterium]|nr:oligoribonuclease [Candidatus Dormibacteraeota bacterium]